MSSIEDLATEASSYFHRIQRGEDTITVLKHDRPEWVQDLAYSAHGDFGPDDWRYDAISAALDHIGEWGDDEDSSEFADSHVDVYTAARYAWLASNLNRGGYCDDAKNEGLAGEDADIADLIGMGQYMEAQEVYGLVLDALRERLEEIEEAEAEQAEV